MKHTVLIGLTGLLFTGASAPAASAPHGKEFFALYGTVKDSREETDTYLDKCQTAGFDVLIPSVSGEGAVIWKTDGEDYYPPLAKKLGEGYDALAEFVAGAHRRGMKVIPSIAIGPVNKLGREHPEWVTRDRSGRPSSETGPSSLAFSYPEARAAKIATLMDLVNHYNVDGLVLDYCRYPEHTKTKETSYGFYGYDQPLVDVCQAVYGFDPRKEAVDSSRWRQFNRLRCDSVSAFIAELREAIRKSGKNVQVIGFGDIDPAMDASMCGRDSAEWCKAGLIDAFLVGTYHSSEQEMPDTIKALRAAIGPDARLYTALTPFADRVTTEDGMIRMAEIALHAGANGLWIYRDDFFEKHGLWNAAAKVREILDRKSATAEAARPTRAAGLVEIRF